MKLGPRHYVPVLKVKRNEKAALQEIPPRFHRRIVPLLEVVQRNPNAGADRTLEQHLATAFKGLADSVRPYPRCFLDARELEGEGDPAAVEVFERAQAAGMNFVPVTGLHRRAGVRAALDHCDRGVALRLTRREFESGELGRDIERFLVTSRVDPGEVDLILDMEDVVTMVPAGVERLAREFLEAVPRKMEWRNLILSGCAFPMGLGKIQAHSHEKVTRSEWLAWRALVDSCRGEVERLPTFSDCGIQHPAGVEGFDPRVMPVSPSIRYALEDAWLIIKGESGRRVPMPEQFRNLAGRLVDGDLRKFFAGEAHCGGCADVRRCADGEGRLGSPGPWRRVGTVHHVTVVMDSLDRLPEPEGARRSRR